MTDAKTSTGARIWSWIFRSAALRGARARMIRATEAPGRAVQQVRLLVEIGHRVAEPAETLPAGARAPVLMSLYRDAVYWGLAARWSGAGAAPAELATLWAETPPEILLDAAKDAPTLNAVKESIFERSEIGQPEANEEDARRARAFAEALLWNLDAPSRQVDQLLLQRWSRVVVLAAVLIVAFAGIRRLALGPNLLDGKPFVTSSTFMSCANPADCDGFFFHTNADASPWVEFDLGARKKVHRLEVKNRSDCCAERAIPLVAEVSTDHTQWTKVAERKEDFDSWTAKFPLVTARYLRLRVDRPSTLHLREVVLR